MPATKAWPAQRSAGNQLTAYPQAIKQATPARAMSFPRRAILEWRLLAAVGAACFAGGVGEVTEAVIDSSVAVQTRPTRHLAGISPQAHPSPHRYKHGPIGAYLLYLAVV